MLKKLVLFLFSAYFIFAQTTETIATEGFNNSVTLFSIVNGAYYSGNSASGDRPANSPFAVEGTYSIGITNGTLTLTSNAINTSGYTNISLTFRLAAFSIGSTSNGVDAGDYVEVSISPDNGTNWYKTITIKGNNNACWAYSATGNATNSYNGSNQTTSFNPNSGGNRTTDGYSTVTITNIPSVNQLKIKIIAYNNDISERWVIDDFKIQGTPVPIGTNEISAGSDPEPASISSLKDTESEELQVFDFNMIDDGSTPSTDNLPTKIQKITIFQGANNQVADWTKVIAGAQLMDENAEIVTGTINNNSIVFSSLPNTNTTDIGYVADNNTKRYMLYIWLKNDMTTYKTTIDNKVLEFKVDYSSFIFASGSNFPSGSGSGTTITSGADKNKIQVVATKLNYAIIPTNATKNIKFIVSVEATDANNNRDLDATNSITLSHNGIGNLISNQGLTNNLNNGIFTWNNLKYDTTGNITITASTTGLTSATSTVNFLEGTLYFEENFNYTAGTLLSNNGWTDFNAPSGAKIDITNTGLTFPGYISSGIGYAANITTNGYEAGKGFSGPNSGNIYLSILVKPTTINSSGDYFAGLNTSESSTNFNLRIFAKQGSATGKVLYGVGTSSTTFYTSSAYEVNKDETHLIIVKYNVNTANPASLWVFTEFPSSEPTTAHASVTPSAFIPGAIFLRQGNFAGLVDGIRVTSTWDFAVLPVELKSFNYMLNNNIVNLNWITASELNNEKFVIERKKENETNWAIIGEVKGQGNSNTENFYTFSDKQVNYGKYYYRLKQVDFNGSYKYTNILEVNLGLPQQFIIKQNYPNPFNPTTKITYAIPENISNTLVQLKIYDILGREVATLVNEKQNSGEYIVEFNANNLPSGTYFARLVAGGMQKTLKMNLVK